MARHTEFFLEIGVDIGDRGNERSVFHTVSIRGFSRFVKRREKIRKKARKNAKSGAKSLKKNGECIIMNYNTAFREKRDETHAHF